MALFTEGRALVETALREEGGTAGRLARLAAGLHALWPAPLTAVLLAGADGTELAVVDEAGRPRPEWHDALRPQLAPGTGGDPPATPAAAADSLGLPEHLLHGGSVGWGGRRYGAVALALHKRTADAALADALLTHLADHLGFRLFLEAEGRQEQTRYRDLADLTNLVGHEFNNVLNSVGLQVAALGTKGLTAEHFPELGEVRKQVAAAGRMVRRLQDLCHKGSPSRQPTDLNRAVRAAVADAPLAGRVALQLDPALPPVQGTTLDLERLVGGLLRGSAADGPGAVTVATGKGTGAAVWLRVEDVGPDPDDDLLPHLFEPFVPVRAGDDGLGLALAKSIARRLGGNLRGEKRPGGGMQFVAELRAAE
ncbi:MAG TPA: HAMP domain-containing sensor histidine kinase, partial [Gemmataceae bacterium]|nr:HAMP domain-containing sensor histidine kinase [Gemmataceae bacterium]